MPGGPSNQPPGADPPAGPARGLRLRRQSHPSANLPRGLRIFLVAAGWVFLVVGVAGLALPGIQGVLTLVAGAALLSVASETAYWALRRAFRRWPGGWRRVERIRRWIYRRVVLTPRTPGLRRADAALSRWERLLLRRLQTSWRLLPLHLLGLMLLIALVAEPLAYERSLWASKLPLALLLTLALVRRRGRERRA